MIIPTIKLKVVMLKSETTYDLSGIGGILYAKVCLKLWDDVNFSCLETLISLIQVGAAHLV